MALITPNFLSGETLIVGDGNFSFSLCLAKALVKNVDVYATSFDAKGELEANAFALENLKELSHFKNFKVLHGVDATNLDKDFQSKLFTSIIFNFPHTGGKVKINKCRKLLENFFSSASKKLEPIAGVVCVSLCQGQGGTPSDTIQREQGNTWQVVEQAAKAGFILKDILPFRESDYPGYKCAGFKGSLCKSFCTSGGLTHVFVLGKLLTPLPSIDSYFTESEDTKQEASPIPVQHLNLNHPIGITRQKIENFLKDLIISGTNIKGFQMSINDSHHQQKKKNICPTNGGNLEFYNSELAIHDKNFEIPSQQELSDLHNESSSCTQENTSLFDQVINVIKEKRVAMVTAGTETDYSVPVSSSSYPISHKLVVMGMNYDGISTDELQRELKFVQQNLSEECFPELKFTNKLSTCKPLFNLDFTKPQMSTFKPVDYQTLRIRGKTPADWRPASQQTAKNVMPVGCCCDSQSDSLCVCCKLEANYFSKKLNILQLIKAETLEEYFCGDKLVMSCGMLDLALIGSYLGEDLITHNNGWIIIIHLDEITMFLYDIMDIRMLWSTEERFLHQFSAKDLLPPQFVPFSLFPPLYLHDISFWLSKDSTEEVFFSTIHKVTQNCVCDLWFRERYVDTEKGAISYNYRMIYSRCDGPLSHLQSVELQNLLRRVLLEKKFLLT